jgi:hypothetical protein
MKHDEIARELRHVANTLRHADLPHSAETVERAISAIESQRWVPVTERLPPNSDTETYWCCVVTQLDGRTQRKCEELARVGDRWFPPLAICETVTHWQPLPAAPEDEKG